MTRSPPLLLASTSRYRRALLERLGLHFEVRSPQVPEDCVAGEPPAQRALRLALAKARAVAEHHPDALIIGSDQVACVGSVILDKPGNAERCREQLALLSGRSAPVFYRVRAHWPASRRADAYRYHNRGVPHSAGGRD